MSVCWPGVREAEGHLAGPAGLAAAVVSDSGMSHSGAQAFAHTF